MMTNKEKQQFLGLYNEQSHLELYDLSDITDEALRKLFKMLFPCNYGDGINPDDMISIQRFETIIEVSGDFRIGTLSIHTDDGFIGWEIDEYLDNPTPISSVVDMLRRLEYLIGCTLYENDFKYYTPKEIIDSGIVKIRKR